ncbi:siderophore-interacting protein [Aestuariibius insulae]|uniref:siderophore-interacting protein n=1 Tax=Aestuariibius insulae TaxID=2058287 RepID=UPI00345EA93B
MTKDRYPLEALADLPGVSFASMRQMMLFQANEDALDILEDEPGRLTVQTTWGLIGLRPGIDAETACLVAAADARWLFALKGGVVEQIQGVLPQLADAIRWSGSEEEGGLPPNFQFVRASKVETLGSAFLRVTLECQDLSSYTDDAIHFRIVLPPRGVAPEWPSVQANGATLWPEGAAAPHKPVYTARAVDHAAHTLLMDVYIHDGGRTTEWAKSIMHGSQERRVIGLLGPGGGGLLNADRVLIASDETGFPAVARLIEGLPDRSSAEVILEAENGAACTYPFPERKDIDVKWLSRSAGDNLGEASIAALARHPKSVIWFAGERQDARNLRGAAKRDDRTPADLRISAFWKTPTGHLPSASPK